MRPVHGLLYGQISRVEPPKSTEKSKFEKKISENIND